MNARCTAAKLPSTARCPETLWVTPAPAWHPAVFSMQPSHIGQSEKAPYCGWRPHKWQVSRSIQIPACLPCYEDVQLRLRHVERNTLRKGSCCQISVCMLVKVGWPSRFAETRIDIKWGKTIFHQLSHGTHFFQGFETAQQDLASVWLCILDVDACRCSRNTKILVY